MKDPYRHLDGQDAYDLLGIADDASREMIQQAFKQRIKRWHPDQHPGRRRPAAERRARYLTAARDILINHRADYDSHRAPPTAGRRIVWFVRRHSPTKRSAALVVIAGWALLLGGCAVVLRLTTDDGLPEPSAAVPREFAGTWTGRAVFEDGFGESFKVRLTLREGRKTGTVRYRSTVRYLGEDCRGTVIPLSMRNGELTLFEDAYGDACQDARIRVSRQGDNLILEYRDESTDGTASAELRRA